MILEAAIINVTRNLDLVSQKEPTAVSSNFKLKEEGLSCLIQLIEKAPQAEYKDLVQSQDCDILIGYLFNVLCQLAKNDKSRKIKCLSLQVVSSLARRLNNFHDVVDLRDRCCISIVESALPGVSSILFKLISSDTKLSKELLEVSIETLGLFITVATKTCRHRDIKCDDKHLKETCHNIAIRTSFLIDYIINNASQLHEDVKYQILNFCHELMCHTRIELSEKVIKIVVKYLAFLSPYDFTSKQLKREIQLKTLLITNHIQEFIETNGNQCDNLESTIISSVFQVLDRLENDYQTMLLSEREGNLSMLYGFLKLLPQKSITTFLQLTDKRNQLLDVLSKLVKFSTTQPFLLLTDVNIGPNALETNGDKIYTVEKRFAYLSHKEVITITSCCEYIAINVEWLTLSDFLNEMLWLSELSSQLFIYHLFTKGLLERPTSNTITKFTSQTISFVMERIQEMCIGLKVEDTDNDMILKTVISIELLVTLIELHVKNCNLIKEKLILLRSTLCPLLNLASSRFRSISEASLSGLVKISQLYQYDSTKSLIEANMDYVVDGVMRLLDSYLSNPEVTDILALTFKLSSIENLYFFRDVYERVFKILGSLHHKGQEKSIALLFYRTLSILKDWKMSKESRNDLEGCLDESTIKMIKFDLDIHRRTLGLKRYCDEIEEENTRIDNILKNEMNEKDICEEIQSGRANSESLDNVLPETSSDNSKSYEIIFIEKIVKLCVHLISSDNQETKILALKAASCGLTILRDHEDTLLPLVHQIWSPLLSRLTSGDYRQDLEVNMCSFECLVIMAECAKDFIKSRLLESVMPKLCLFLETQAFRSKDQKDYGPYCMTMAYRCQLTILKRLGFLSYHTEVAYTSLWRIIGALLMYLAEDQVPSLKQAAVSSLQYLMILDADCVWYFSKQTGHLKDLPFDLIYKVT